jgi:hypothetical protein
MPVVAVLLAMFCGAAAFAVDYPGPPPGPAAARPAAARLGADRLVLENAALAISWRLSGDRLGGWELADRSSKGTAPASQEQAFWLSLADGRTISSAELRLTGKPTLEKLSPQPRAVCLADRSAGWKASATLASADGTLQVEWQVVLRDQANYLRQEVTLKAEGKEVSVERLTLLDAALPNAAVHGVVEGSPVVAGSLFAACEHPTASNRVENGRTICSAAAYEPLRADRSFQRSCVLGVAPPGQLRRAFLYYVERERPRPYQPFLHYNSWYDIAWGDRKMNGPQCVGVIELFGRELVERRKVVLDSLVFDDGWDDNRTLWRFHPGFPQGFDPLAKAATKYQSAVGVWLSPWGGYGQAKAERMKYGKTQGFETNRNGFSLAGPSYYGRFRDVCAEMIEKYGINYFKFDGIAQGISSPGAGKEFGPDVEALLRLLGDLRRLRPDVFINVTTGTWPSPYWLLFGDSTWRNGGDMGFAGPGSKRQQWLTYRDMITYQWIVRRGPLYPINSLMNQGICQAQLGSASQLGDDLKEWTDEVRSFFGTGTQTQELYVSPQLLTPAMWDVLAEGARWSRRNADVLADVHWVGGDPGRAEPYGFAAWSPRQGVLTLRNPGAAPATIAVDVGQVFELPPDVPRTYRLASPWKQPEAGAPVALQAGQPHVFNLAPFEVRVFDAIPVR